MPNADPIPLVKDIAIGTAASSLFFMIAATVPLVGIAAAVLVPLPVIFFRGKQGRMAALAIVTGTILVLWTCVDMAAGDLLFIVCLLTIGASLGELIHQPISLERLVGTVCGAVATVVFCALLIASDATDRSISQLVAEYVDQSLAIWVQIYAENGLGTADQERLKTGLDQLGRILIWLMPAMILSTTLVITWVNLLMARAVYRWRQQPFPDFGALDQWSAPEPMVWAAIASGLLLVLPVGESLTVIGGNAGLIVATIYFFHGIAIVHFFMEKKQIPRALRVITYSLLVLQTLLAFLVAGIGLIDLWLDLRKLKTNGSG